MNRVILFGNVGKDPEVKTFEGGNKVAKFSLATNKSYTKNNEKVTETSWHNIVLWGKLAELAEKYVKKGNSIIIEGEISYRSYENKDGVTIYVTEINGDRLHFAGGKKEDESIPKTGKVPTKAMSDTNELPGNIDDGSVPDDRDIPFL